MTDILSEVIQSDVVQGAIEAVEESDAFQEFEESSLAKSIEESDAFQAFEESSLYRELVGTNEVNDDAQYKLEDETTYADEIIDFRFNHSDADDLFNKRDEAIQVYKDSLSKSKEEQRIASKRLETLNGYIERLIIGYFKKKEAYDEQVDEAWQKMADDLPFPMSGSILKVYANSPINDFVCNAASFGLPIISDVITDYCLPKNPIVTGCNAADITQFQGDCFGTYTDDDENGKGPAACCGGWPAHLAWGQIDTTQSGCASGWNLGFVAGLATGNTGGNFDVARQEKGECGLGYYMGQGPDDTFNWTRSHLYTDQALGPGEWPEMGNMNHFCAVEVGGNVIEGINAFNNLNTAYGPPDLQFGASEIQNGALAVSDSLNAPTGERAKCKLGYYYKDANNIVQIPEGTTQCQLKIDTTGIEKENSDTICRKQIGFGQNSPSIDQPSQYTYGRKDLYDLGDKGCSALTRRITCEMGYSNGVKLDPWTSDCIARTNVTGQCKRTYGDGWFSWPQTQSSWNQGCQTTATSTRVTCRKDDMVPIGTEFTNKEYTVAKQECTTAGWGGFLNPDYACNGYGPNFKFTGFTQDVSVNYGTPTDSNDPDADYTNFSVSDDKCIASMYRSKCKKTRDIGDFKNSICLWTNNSCGGQSCKSRCESLGKGWVALNEDKNCNSLQGGEFGYCICCTVNNYDDDGTIINKTDEYLNTDNPYYSAILDTGGKVSGQTAGHWEAGTNDTFLCKHAAYWNNHYNERECTSNLTTDLDTAMDDPGHYTYVPLGSDITTMKNHLNTYKNIAGEGPSACWLNNSSNYTWTDHYGGNLCRDYSNDQKNKSEFRSCIDTDGNQPSGFQKVSGGTFDVWLGTTYAWNKS